jgi:hypothetical protein
LVPVPAISNRFGIIINQVKKITAKAGKISGKDRKEHRYSYPALRPFPILVCFAVKGHYGKFTDRINRYSFVNSNIICIIFSFSDSGILPMNKALQIRFLSKIATL